jgi:hypothetical protein
MNNGNVSDTSPSAVLLVAAGVWGGQLLFAVLIIISCNSR